MYLKINSSSGVPIYRQIVDQVKVLVATGALERGAKLPSVRQLSEMLVVNPTTIQRAYLDLENEGVIETRRGQGTYVLGDGVALQRGEGERRAAEHLRNALVEARRLNLSRAQTEKLILRELKAVFGDDADGGKS
jgi:GntR family transcriptional regulator